MARLHLRHRDIAPEVLEAVKEMNDRKPWTLPRALRQEAATQFATRICSLGSVAPPEIIFERGRSRRPYTYCPATTTGSLGLTTSAAQIEFRRWRTVDVIAAVRHHVSQVTDIRDLDPMDWACSAFYQACPSSFRASARNGKVPGVTTKDTFTTESWLKLVAHGLVDSRGRLRFSTSEVTYFLAHGEFRSTDEDEDSDVSAVDTANLGSEPYTDEIREEIEADIAGVVAEEDTPEQVDTVAVDSAVADGLDALGIVQLRKVSRGFVSGGYSMPKPTLIHAIRQNTPREELASRIAAVTR